MGKVFLISCTKSKQDYQCTAEEMYKPSPLYQNALDYALQRVEDKNNQIFILSAKYGLLTLTSQIAPYELTLKNMPSVECAQWGKRVYEQLAKLFDINKTEFIFLAGNDYIEPLRTYLPIYKNPLQGMPLGVRVQWLGNNANAVSTENSQKNTRQEMYEEKSNNVSMISLWAKDLRTKEKLNRVPDDKPGYYRFWAPTKALEQLLNSPHISSDYMKKIQQHMTRRKFADDFYYCIYVGVAIKGSIRSRLDWHINQNHTQSAVNSGTLSTFRQSIASLLSGNQYDEDATNEFLDLLMLEYCALDYTIKSEVAETVIEQIENEEQSKHVLALNIKGNNHAIMQPFLQEVRDVRRMAKFANIKDNISSFTKDQSASIDEDIEGLPICDICESKMVSRTNRVNGNVFLGCSEYPNCTYTTPVDNKKSLIEKPNYQVTLENTQHQLKANAKTKTSDVVSYLTKKFANAKASGKSSIIIKSGDIHKELGLVSRMPTVCGAMRKLMKHGDIVHYQPPKGKGATLCIEYFL